MFVLRLLSILYELVFYDLIYLIYIYIYKLPAEASIIEIAPSSTLNDLSTSILKSI